jgi:hypothetical protein
MRSMPPILFAAALLAAPVAVAAPTCQDRNSDTIRCETAGAMPVGWTLPAAERRERRRSEVQGPGLGAFVGLGAFLVGFFGLIALLPDFDGCWDREEGDDEEPG